MRYAFKGTASWLRLNSLDEIPYILKNKKGRESDGISSEENCKALASWRSHKHIHASTDSDKGIKEE